MGLMIRQSNKYTKTLAVIKPQLLLFIQINETDFGVQICYEKFTYLTPEVPLWVNCIVDGFRTVFLGAHRNDYVWI